MRVIPSATFLKLCLQQLVLFLSVRANVQVPVTETEIKRYTENGWQNDRIADTYRFTDTCTNTSFVRITPYSWFGYNGLVCRLLLERQRVCWTYLFLSIWIGKRLNVIVIHWSGSSNHISTVDTGDKFTTERTPEKNSYHSILCK